MLIRSLTLCLAFLATYSAHGQQFDIQGDVERTLVDLNWDNSVSSPSFEYQAPLEPVGPWDVFDTIRDDSIAPFAFAPGSGTITVNFDTPITTAGDVAAIEFRQKSSVESNTFGQGFLVQVDVNGQERTGSMSFRYSYTMPLITEVRFFVFLEPGDVVSSVSFPYTIPEFSDRGFPIGAYDVSDALYCSLRLTAGKYVVDVPTLQEAIDFPPLLQVEAGAAMDDLLIDVLAINDTYDIPNGTDDKLLSAIDALEAENADARQDAANKLTSFINSVEAQRGKKIPNEEADLLVFYANRIIGSL